MEIKNNDQSAWENENTKPKKAQEKEAMKITNRKKIERND
jgi:hypothetical protein